MAGTISTPSAVKEAASLSIASCQDRGAPTPARAQASSGIKESRAVLAARNLEGRHQSCRQTAPLRGSFFFPAANPGGVAGEPRGRGGGGRRAWTSRTAPGGLPLAHALQCTPRGRGLSQGSRSKEVCSRLGLPTSAISSHLLAELKYPRTAYGVKRGECLWTKALVKTLLGTTSRGRARLEDSPCQRSTSSPFERDLRACTVRPRQFFDVKPIWVASANQPAPGDDGASRPTPRPSPGACRGASTTAALPEGLQGGGSPGYQLRLLHLRLTYLRPGLQRACHPSHRCPTSQHPVGTRPRVVDGSRDPPRPSPPADPTALAPRRAKGRPPPRRPVRAPRRSDLADLHQADHPGGDLGAGLGPCRRDRVCRHCALLPRRLTDSQPGLADHPCLYIGLPSST